ncbi:hypothetical protein B0H19DRAFT_1083323 [Mycena capillaripes]|nr:hypothetical protein B0H19DRAFT_1083323 [Mycena capillaripes]
MVGYGNKELLQGENIIAQPDVIVEHTRLEIVMGSRYFARPTRPLAHRIGVSVLVVAETVSTLAIGLEVCLTVGIVPANFLVALTALVMKIITTYLSAARS